MDIKQGRTHLILKDLRESSIWKLNDSHDLYYPVTCSQDFPEDDFDLRIRAKFFTPSGIELVGYIVGVQDIFSIAIYVDSDRFGFNRNLPGDYSGTLDKLSKALGKRLTIENFSPLKYITDIDLEGFRNIEGEFDLLKKRTEEERLRGL